MTKLSSRKLNESTSSVMRAAEHGPVFITARGRVTHVLLTFKDYQRINSTPKSIVALLEMAEAAEIEFEPPRMGSASWGHNHF